jgi:hypothetical protein
LILIGTLDKKRERKEEIKERKICRLGQFHLDSTHALAIRFSIFFIYLAGAYLNMTLEMRSACKPPGVSRLSSKPLESLLVDPDSTKFSILLCNGLTLQQQQTHTHDPKAPPIAWTSGCRPWNIAA